MNDQSAPIAPAIDSLWQFHDGSPWPPAGSVVRVLDVKEGWVRYTRITTGGDERCMVTSFVASYVPYVHNEVKP